MSNQDERRRYTRVDFANDAVLDQENNSVQVHLIDISLKGVLIGKPLNYTFDSSQTASIIITLTDEIIIEMQVMLAHTSEDMLGFQCNSIDMMSMTHLRRLIELNIQLPDASERVLDELISPTNVDTNRRREKRYPHREECTLELGDNSYGAHMLNISEHGALVAVMQDHGATQGETICLKVHSDSEPIVLKGTTAHVKLHYIGLRCDATDDANLDRIRHILSQK